MDVTFLLAMTRTSTGGYPPSEREDASMRSSTRLTRRHILTAAAAVAALKRYPVRAQTPADLSCTISLLNGLLQYSPDCPLVTPPAFGAEVAPPSHLVSLALAADSATGTTSGDKVPQSGSRRKRHNARQAQRRKFARNRHHRRRKLNRAARHRRHKRRH
jgi:hypothetical protein